MWSDRGRADHVLVRVGSCYLDGDGISTLDELVERWVTVERVNVQSVAPVTDRWLRDNHADYPEPDAQMKMLAWELHSHFGPLGAFLDAAGCR